jgi:DNA invertase Pin-like site-specific DNA recombinase
MTLLNLNEKQPLELSGDPDGFETDPIPLDVASFKRLKATKNGNKLLKMTLKECLVRLKENYTADEIEKLLGVKRMTIYRWINTGKINDCYSTLLLRLQNDMNLGEDPKDKILETGEALRRLKNHKEIVGTWDKLAKKIGTERWTVLRWLKTGQINQGYLRILYYFFNESVDGLRL